MRRFEEKEWTFLNANSPADLQAEYLEDGSVRLAEYDRNRNGHLLISRFFVDSEASEFEAEVKDAEDGVTVGYYFGGGNFHHFIQVVLKEGRVSVMIPTGVPLGDTFRYEGAKRVREIDGADYGGGFPASLKIIKQRRKCSVYVNGVEYLVCGLPEICEKRWARLLVGAVNTGGKSLARTVATGYRVTGKTEFPVCSGILTDERGCAMKYSSVHLCAFGDKWARTDEKGRFEFENLPPGLYDGVAGKEGGTFFRLKLDNFSSEIRIREMKKIPLAEKELFAEIEDETARVSLNGIWNFDWDRKKQGETRKWYLPGNHYFFKVIQVPFSFHSLEAFGEGFLADGYNGYEAAAWYVNLKETGDRVWYQRTVEIPENGRWELVIGAVSGFAKVWIDGKCVGCTVDSYERFRFAMGEKAAGEMSSVVISVEYPQNHDESCRGKQDFWFHSSPGIWQNVWMEKTQAVRAEDILIQYGLSDDGASVSGNVFLEIQGEDKTELVCRRMNGGTAECSLSGLKQGFYKVVLSYESDRTENIYFKSGEKILCKRELDATGYKGYFDKAVFYFKFEGEETFTIENSSIAFHILQIEAERVELPLSVETMFLDKVFSGIPVCTDEGRIAAKFKFEKQRVQRWSPENPVLYDVEVTIVRNQKNLLKFRRKIGFRDVKTEQYVKLNGNDIYIRGVLDQGYNPWGIYTYPFDRGGRGSMSYDIEKAEKYGYNLIRMHIKDTEPLWYRLCDEKGMLVWDEHPVNFYARWDNPRWRAMYRRRLKDMIRKHNYHPCVIIYSTFNESWGITGGHEMSPWSEPKAQKWQKEMAVYYKKNCKGNLVVDNSGYAKTSATDILDYHMYPDEFEDARDFFAKMERENYPGSCFNCYNTENSIIMQEESRRELLQRNCCLDLKNIDYTGQECQHGQPVFISEFVHTGRIEQMVRIYEGIAGYIRMNLASQENEDTSPLTAERIERNWGYRHADFTDAGYEYVNGKHLVWPDIPVLSKRNAGETVQIPVITRIWSEIIQDTMLEIYESRTDLNGRETMPQMIWTEKCETIAKKPMVSAVYDYKVPQKVRAVQLFFRIKANSMILAENDVRFEVFEPEQIVISCRADRPEKVITDSIHGKLCRENGREGYFIAGKGTAWWRIYTKPEMMESYDDGKWFLRMELSTSECIWGTRITDEQKFAGTLELQLNGKRKILISLADAPWDEKAVFSNSACGTEQAVPYKKWGKYGYGCQVDIALNEEEKRCVKKEGCLVCKISSDNSGMILYGRRMGRYGTEPIIISEEEI